MKKTAQAFAAATPGQNAWRAVIGAPPSASLVDVSLACADALADWQTVVPSAEAETFLVAMLVKGRG